MSGGLDEAHLPAQLDFRDKQFQHSIADTVQYGNTA